MEMLFCSTVVGLPFLIPPMLLTGELSEAWSSCSEVKNVPLPIVSFDSSSHLQSPYNSFTFSKGFRMCNLNDSISWCRVKIIIKSIILSRRQNVSTRPCQFLQGS